MLQKSYQPIFLGPVTKERIQRKNRSMHKDYGTSVVIGVVRGKFLIKIRIISTGEVHPWIFNVLLPSCSCIWVHNWRRSQSYTCACKCSFVYVCSYSYISDRCWYEKILIRHIVDWLEGIEEKKCVRLLRFVRNSNIKLRLISKITKFNRLAIKAIFSQFS